MNNYEKKYKEALDKAKRYDEVFNAAKEWYNNPNSSNIGKSYLYAVFPELKESEDEEIRKSIIENLKGNMCRTDGDYDLLNKQIAWLEKQKEFVSEDFDDVWETADCDELTAPLEKYSKDAIKEMCHAWYDKGIELERRNWLEKQGEQKITDKVEPKFKVKYAGNEYNVFEVKDIAGITFYGIEDEPNHIDYVQAENCERVGGYSIKEKGSPYPTKPAKFSEQKTAWSEDDEVMLGEIIDFFENGTVKLQHDLSLYASWLKSLKGRVGCEVNCTTTKKWKPSDEQLFDLKVIAKQNEHNMLGKSLMSLYNDLLKLKE